MGTGQKDAAQQEMVRWLSQPQEFGRIPAQIECIGKFEMQELRYYVFRCKKQPSGKWSLGVCGGYKGETLEHCGHIFREEEEYGEDEVAERAKQLVKRVRRGWIEQEQNEKECRKKPGNFVNFVLLEDAVWDKEELQKELKENWKLPISPEGSRFGSKAGENGAGKGPETGKSTAGINRKNMEKTVSEDLDSLVLRCEGAKITVTMNPEPMPGDEVEYGARKNHTWHNAAVAVRRHCAYLSVKVEHGKLSSIESGILLVKTVAACCVQQGVLGIYANGTVYQVEQYRHFSGMARAGVFPVQNLIWFGRYNGKKGLCGYTFGLSQFGYDEIEVLNSSVSEQELDDFLFALVNHIIYHNVVLKHGEVIGFQTWQKLPITKSKGVAVPGESLKIVFPGVKTSPKAASSGYIGEI